MVGRGEVHCESGKEFTRKCKLKKNFDKNTFGDKDGKKDLNAKEKRSKEEKGTCLPEEKPPPGDYRRLGDEKKVGIREEGGMP